MSIGRRSIAPSIARLDGGGASAMLFRCFRKSDVGEGVGSVLPPPPLSRDCAIAAIFGRAEEEPHSVASSRHTVR